MYAGIELGGTKIRCAVGVHAERIDEECHIETTSPKNTFTQIRQFLDKFPTISSIGIASFGPIQIDSNAADFGVILDTPKAGWRGANLAGVLKDMAVPIGVDTDVNAAAMAEWNARGRLNETLVYITVGTGVGGGIIANGRPLGSAMHPELGHMLIPRAESDSEFAGVCPFHGDCLEGLASGSAMSARWGCRGEHLAADHPAWSLQAEYMATLCVNLQRMFAPGAIVLGGGVMHSENLLERIRSLFIERLGGYYVPPKESGAELILAPKLGSDSGLLGAMQIAQQSLADAQ